MHPTIFRTTDTAAMQALSLAGFPPSSKGMVDGVWTVSFTVPSPDGAYMAFVRTLMNAGVRSIPPQPQP